MAYKVTLRTAGRVDRTRAETLDGAIEAARAALRAAPRRPAIDLRVRSYGPAEQVAARAEIAGDGARGGVDVRGDGSTQAWTGRVRRQPVEARAGEDAYDALRRVLAGG